jgi:hypothetical protein
MYKTSKVAFSPHVRKSTYFNSTIKYGVETFSVYNHMYMPVSYDGPVEDYKKLLNAIVYSPRLNKNISYVILDIEHAKIGQEITISSPEKELTAITVEIPWLNRA